MLGFVDADKCVQKTTCLPTLTIVRYSRPPVALLSLDLAEKATPGLFPFQRLPPGVAFSARCTNDNSVTGGPVSLSLMLFIVGHKTVAIFVHVAIVDGYLSNQVCY